MVREEYLNIEFMYKFINSLCKRDGYHLIGFEFGKMGYYNATPVVLRNNNGYNMVYKFTAYKTPEKLNLRHTVYLHPSMCSDPFNGAIVKKTFCFDISSECIVEYDEKNCWFNPYPAFFRLDNQLYYSIYNKPKVLSYHYSPGREKERIYDYMKCMGIDCYNIFSPAAILAYCGEKVEWHSGIGDAIYYDSAEQANERVLKALTTNHDCISWRCPVKNYRVCIHKGDVPVFYTDNILELTIPLAEDIKKLSVNMERSLRQITYCMNLMSNSIQGLIESRLEDINRFASLQRQYARRVVHQSQMTIEQRERSHRSDMERLEDGYAGNMCSIKDSIADIGNSCDFHMESSDLYGKIMEKMVNLDSETFSIDSLCELAKDLDLLDTQIRK